MELTPKEELYVQGLVMGLSQREAYKQAYNCTKWKDTTIDVRACELFKTSKIQVRFKELMEEHKQKALWTREEATKSLKFVLDEAIENIKEIGIKQANTNAVINAIKELNKLELETGLDIKKKEIDIEYVKAKVELIKGAKKDTSLLDALVGVFNEK